LLRDESDHPRAQATYYKLQLGPLQQLPRPFLAKSWRQITFFYTTGEYLQHANTLNDMVLGIEERPTLWQALRERVCQKQHYGNQETSDNPPLDLDPGLLAALLGLSHANPEIKNSGGKF